ncbi:ADP-ribosylglycohydrolase family protein [Streptomyces sp. ST2-7A]|uniref:ADP-ribosylglycohydrolase family protein n=1 Tax=Streptomyces sp. ST2-7A TaxID=2907214 RepID=UPI001F44F342|nr:ADP-ribosylglycohydrolase family protein [Streptomyces sp. ST2-7A]MCE7078955.1 ADP-ribosylglycohydrolase family protein [Streptomyces sp. ST2-7A]
MEGLALGDSFGERWFHTFRPRERAAAEIARRESPVESPWRWTDDTAMAASVLRVLHEHGEVRPDRLAELFAGTFAADAHRGYGSGMHLLLPELAVDPTAWPTASRRLFGGEGSLGNGAAMRVAPLGAWYAGDPSAAAAAAVLSARVTHAHPEGVAGAVAVAVATAILAGDDHAAPTGTELLTVVAGHLSAGEVRDGLVRAADLPGDAGPLRAAALLGSGDRVRADDTVPFALWCAAHRADDLTEALWTTAAGFGDVDTTCAIVGGVVAARTGVAGAPPEWLERREPLPPPFAR